MLGDAIFIPTEVTVATGVTVTNPGGGGAAVILILIAESLDYKDCKTKRKIGMIYLHWHANNFRFGQL